MESLLRTFTAAQSTRQPYRGPTAAELRTAEAGFAAFLDNGPHRLADLGFSVRDDSLAVHEPGTERAWGLYAIDRSAPPSLVVLDLMLHALSGYEAARLTRLPG